MRVAVFSTKRYEGEAFSMAEEAVAHDFEFLEARLNRETVGLAAGFEAICAFVNDVLDAPVIDALADSGARVIALRSAGFDHVEDLSDRVIQDNIFTRLLTFPNVLVTGHQAFFTQEALGNIVATTLRNISDCEAGRPCLNEVDETLWSAASDVLRTPEGDGTDPYIPDT